MEILVFSKSAMVFSFLVSLLMDSGSIITVIRGRRVVLEL